MTQRVGIAPQHEVTKAQHREWAAKLWKRMDRDNSGSLEHHEMMCDEFQSAMRSVISPVTAGQSLGNYGRAELNSSQCLKFCMKMADKNNDGVLDFEEFDRFWRVLRRHRRNPDLVFTMYDLDQGNSLDREELTEIFRYFLGHKPTREELEHEWLKMDVDGKIL